MILQLTPDLEEKLGKLAGETERPVDELVREALTSYLQHIKLLADEVREGEESAELDGWLTTDEVFERLHHRTHNAA